MAGQGDMAALVAAAAAGRSLAQIAAAAGLSISSVQRRLRDPEIADAVQEARLECRRRAVGRMLELRDAALTRVGDLLAADDPVLALRAATLILNTGLKVEAAYDFHDRLAALEAAQDELERGEGDDDADPGEGDERAVGDQEWAAGSADGLGE